MPVQRLSSQEAIAQVASDSSLVHIDVRSEPEFAAGHAPGAYNVPLMHKGPTGMTPNPSFAADVARLVPDRSAPIVVSCQGGVRSARAAAALESLGYTRLSDHIGGWGGGNGDAGWPASGGPSTTATQPGHSYAELKG